MPYQASGCLAEMPQERHLTPRKDVGLQISGSRVVQARGLWEWNSPAGYKMASNRQTREWPMEPLI